jgi:hypothetical protein
MALHLGDTERVEMVMRYREEVNRYSALNYKNREMLPLPLPEHPKINYDEQ